MCCVFGENKKEKVIDSEVMNHFNRTPLSSVLEYE